MRQHQEGGPGLLRLLLQRPIATAAAGCCRPGRRGHCSSRRQRRCRRRGKGQGEGEGAAAPLLVLVLVVVASAAVAIAAAAAARAAGKGGGGVGVVVLRWGVGLGEEWEEPARQVLSAGLQDRLQLRKALLLLLGLWHRRLPWLRMLVVAWFEKQTTSHDSPISQILF